MSDSTARISELKLLLSVLVIIVSIVITFTVVKIQVQENTKRIDAIEVQNSCLSELTFNLKRLCESMGIQYIERN